ncbi:MAG TPA: TPM domain-containing protein [Candidatus Limnocylindria bacterium]|nr:TPM domain-containing protein [Candidatus Limnocylindria bacterium]
MTAVVLALLLQFAFVANATALDLPPLKTTISDFAGMFPPASLEELEHRLHRFATETANHVAILTVKTLDDTDIDALARQAFNRLPLSDTERNKTVLLVIARAEHEVGFHAGESLQHLLPPPATRDKLREQVGLYINGLRPDLGIHGAVHYLFRALRGDVRVGSQSADNELEEISLSGRGAGAIFALFIAPFLAFFVGGLWGVYATQFGVQRWPRLAMGAIFGGGTAKVVITITAFVGGASDSLWYFIMALAIPLGVFGSCTEFWMSGDWRGIPREKGPRRKPEDNMGI